MPILEWALAAQWWHLDWTAFCELDGSDQAFLVAVYRTAKRIESVEMWRQSKKKS